MSRVRVPKEGADGGHLPSTDAPSHRPLRSDATFLPGLGRARVVLCTLVGISAWFFVGWPTVPAGPDEWAPWLLDTAPALGLLVGVLAGFGCFVLSGVIRVLLDQRDFVEALPRTGCRAVRVLEWPRPNAPSVPQGLFDLAAGTDTDEPVR